MQRLRTLSTRRLIALAVALVVLVAGVGIAQASLQRHPTPPPKPLDVAVHDALSASAVPGVSARIAFANRLLPTGALPDGAASPLVAGASGRLWVRADGRFRVELQSQAGDAQIVSDGRVVTVYDASANTVYRLALPRKRATTPNADRHHAPPTLAQVQRAIADVARHWSLSGAIPTSTAGEPAYTLRIAPKGEGGLLAAAELAWDARNGVPLRAAVYAKGQAAPVLELRATDVSFRAVPLSDVSATPPPGAKVVDLTPSAPVATASPERPHATPPAGPGSSERRHAKPPHGLAAVQAALPFTLAAPDTLAGLPRSDVWLAAHGGRAAAVIVYGKGLGAIVVVERQAKAGEPPLGAPPSGGGRDRSLRLAQVDVDGTAGHELATALGTAIAFQRGGVDTVVAGSVPARTAETAARQLG
jgi:outer membrane lipoprotein-sorting protein